MNRLIEKTVFSGLVMAWRFATCPTRVSPSFVKATTEGVRRLPSWLAMTVGSPPSITATTEFVVPRSMPITFAMSRTPVWLSLASRLQRRRGEARHPARGACVRLQHVDLDLLGFELLGLGEADGQHPVTVRGLDLVGLHRNRQRERALEFPEPPLVAIHVVLLGFLAPLPLSLQGEHVPGDREMDVLLVQAGQLGGQNELVLRLVYVDGGRPYALRREDRGRPAEEAVEEPVHLGLHVVELTEWIETRAERTESSNRHTLPLLESGRFSGLYLSLLNLYPMSHMLSSNPRKRPVRPINSDIFDYSAGGMLASAYEARLHGLYGSRHRPGDCYRSGRRRHPLSIGQYLWQPRGRPGPLHLERRLRGSAEALRGSSARVGALQPPGSDRADRSRGHSLSLQVPRANRGLAPGSDHRPIHPARDSDPGPHAAPPPAPGTALRPARPLSARAAGESARVGHAPRTHQCRIRHRRQRRALRQDRGR